MSHRQPTIDNKVHPSESAIYFTNLPIGGTDVTASLQEGIYDEPQMSRTQSLERKNENNCFCNINKPMTIMLIILLVISSVNLAVTVYHLAKVITAENAGK